MPPGAVVRSRLLLRAGVIAALFLPVCAVLWIYSLTQFMFIAVALHWLFWLLSRPKSGVLGSIAIAVTLLSAGQDTLPAIL